MSTYLLVLVHSGYWVATWSLVCNPAFNYFTHHSWGKIMSLFPTWIAHPKAIAETLRTYRLHMSGAFTLRQELAPLYSYCSLYWPRANAVNTVWNNAGNCELFNPRLFWSRLYEAWKWQTGGSNRLVQLVLAMRYVLMRHKSHQIVNKVLRSTTRIMWSTYINIKKKDAFPNSGDNPVCQYDQ